MIENDETYDNYRHIEATVGAELHVELGNRFIVLSEADDSIEMIFTAAHFNISHFFNRTRTLLVVQIYEILREEIITLKFLLSFTDDDTASRFYKYIKEDRSSVTDNIIPVDIPSRIIKLYNP